MVHGASASAATRAAARSGDPSRPIANECSRGHQASEPSSSSTRRRAKRAAQAATSDESRPPDSRSEEHTSELQSLMRISYAVFCLKKKNNHHSNNSHIYTI